MSAIKEIVNKIFSLPSNATHYYFSSAHDDELELIRISSNNCKIIEVHSMQMLRSLLPKLLSILTKMRIFQLMRKS